MRYRSFVLGFASAICIGLHLDAQTCQLTASEPVVQLSADGTLLPPAGGWPAGATQWFITTSQTPVVRDDAWPSGSLTGGRIAISPLSVSIVSARLQGSTPPILAVLQTAAPAPTCTTFSILAPSAPQTPVQPQPPETRERDQSPIDAIEYSEGDCSRAGGVWANKVRSTTSARMADRKDRFTMLIFNSSGIICYRNRDYGVQGDPIYTAVFVTNPAEWNGVDNTFDPCALEPTAPAILASGNLEQIRAGFSAQRYSVRPFPPRSCFSAAVTIAVIGALKVPEGTPAQSVNFRTTLNQYERFRATLQVGVLNTPQHANNFGLRDSAGTKLIYNQGPSNRGPEYLASVVIFGLPRYLQTLTQGTQYSGRDVLHDNSLMDRIGAVVGTSLSNPGKRFAAGASLELLYGANALFVWDVAQTNRLSGVKEGAVWTAAAADLPIEKTWQSRFVLGLSLDIGYATKLFGK